MKSRGFTLFGTGESKGFTLIELLVVIAIIGLLASIVLAALSPARKRGRDARRITDMKQIQLALQLYYDIANPASYPATAATGGTWPSAALQSALVPAYISALPVDPINDGANYFYQYQATNGASAPLPCGTAPCAGYVLQANTETDSVVSAISGLQAGIQCTTGGSAPFHYCMKP